METSRTEYIITKATEMYRDGMNDASEIAECLETTTEEIAQIINVLELWDKGYTQKACAEEVGISRTKASYIIFPDKIRRNLDYKRSKRAKNNTHAE